MPDCSQRPAQTGQPNVLPAAGASPLTPPEPTPPKPAPIVYTVEEAAAVLNVSTKTIRRLLARRLLTCSNALRKKLIPRQQLEDFLKATCETPQRF